MHSAGANPPGCFANTPTANEWEQGGFTHPNLSSLVSSQLYPPNDRGYYSHGLYLNLVLLRNAGWTQDEVMADIKAAAQVYKQCGIKITGAAFTVADSPTQKVDFDGPTKVDPWEVAARTPGLNKPTIYFFRSFQDGNTAYSFAWSKFPDHDKAAKFGDTSWIARTVHDSDARLYSTTHHTQPPFSAVAHELGHLLDPDSGHVRDGSDNVMGDSIEHESGRLTPAQCARFKQSPLLKKL